MVTSLVNVTAASIVNDGTEASDDSSEASDDASEASDDSSEDRLYEIRSAAVDIIEEERPARSVFEALKTYCNGRQLDIEEVAKCIETCHARCQEESNVCNICNSQAKEILIFIFIYCSSERIRPDVAAELLRILSCE